MNPIIPNKKSPPIIPNKIKEECIWVLLETIIGFRRLSKTDENIPNIPTPTAEKVFPDISKYAETGSQIMVVPITGNIPAIAANRVISNALGTPKRKKPIPTRTPWSKPIITCP